MFGARREGFEDSEFGGSECRILLGTLGACRSWALHPKLCGHTSHLKLRFLVHLVLLYTGKNPQPFIVLPNTSRPQVIPPLQQLSL